MAATIDLQENVRCVVLPILSLLAMIETTPVLKTPLK